MGNVNEAASETAHSGGVNTKELPGALQTSQEDDATNSEALTNSDNVNDGIPPSPSLSTEDERDPVDISRPSSPVSYHDADPSVTQIATASSSDIQSPPDGIFDPSSNSSFPISDSALPATFDVSAEISFLNTRELSDYFVTPSLTHLDIADQVPLSEMSSVTSVAAQTGQSLSSSYGRSFTVPPTSTEKGALGPDCPSGPLLASDALILSRNGDDATKLLSTNAAKGRSGTDDSVSNLSVTALGLNPATLSTSTIGAIASVDSHRNVLLIQPSVHIPEATGSFAPIPVVSAHASHQQPRETLVAIDNVVAVIRDAVSTTKSTAPKSEELLMDKEAILANIPPAATYADAANLAAQHPELAKELLNRPLLAPSQAAAPAVPEISYAAPARGTQDARPGDHRRARRRGGKKCRTQSQSSSRNAQDSKDRSKDRHMQDEDTRSRYEMRTDKRSGRLDVLPHLDRPRNSSRNQRNIGDPSRTGRQAAHQPDHRDADGSRGPLDPDDWRPSHDQLVSDTQGQLIQDQPVSRVPSHETRKAKTSDQSNADKWTHTHDPLAPVNQQHSGSHSNIQVVRQIVSDTDKWGPAHDPWSSETPSGRLPGSHSRVSHNVTSNTYASDARDNLWQARHDPWLAEQPVTSDVTSRKYHHKHAPSVVQHMYPAHNSSQPIASISSQSGRSRDVNAGLRANGLDPHRFVRQQQVVGINDVARQYLGNECECERRFSSAETGGTGQTVLGSTPSEEPRSMSSPPRIVACLDDKERLHMIGAGSATEWHRARPPTPAMVSTRPFELGELQLKTAPSTKSGNTGDAHFRKVHHSASSVDFNSERDPRISKTMIVEPGNLISHVGSREDQVICQPDVHRLIGDVTRDAVPQCINSLHSNANVNLSSIPLALMPQNDLASHTLQNSISSNVHLSESCPGAEKAAHSQTGFDPRAEGWLTNFGSGGRKPVGEPYDASPSRPRHSLQPGSSSVYAYGNRDGQQRGTDPRKRPSPLADAHRYAYGTRPRGDSGGNNLRS